MSEWLKCEANVRAFYFYSLRIMLLIFSLDHGNIVVRFRNTQQIEAVLRVHTDFKSLSHLISSINKFLRQYHTPDD